MYAKIFNITTLLIVLTTGLSAYSLPDSDTNTETTESYELAEEAVEAVEDNIYSDNTEEDIDDIKRPTNVIIREYYFDCININSDVDKLTANFSVVSNESCSTLYRFAAFQITYDVIFKNGTTAQTMIALDLQDSERTTDTMIVTLTGKVVEGYLTGAHFQSVIVYPVLNDTSKCLSESGITDIRSNSASVTFILLPNNPTNEQSDSLSARSPKLPEAFDCFGNASIDYIPGLVDFKHLWSESSNNE